MTVAQIIGSHRNGQESAGRRSRPMEKAIRRNCWARPTLFMQNKANFRKGQMSISIFTIKDYENKPAFGTPENEPKQSQFQNAIWFKMGKNERESILSLVEWAQHEVSSLVTWQLYEIRQRSCLERRQRLPSSGAELASHGGTNLWQNLRMGAIKSSLKFGTVPTLMVGPDMCLG